MKKHESEQPETREETRRETFAPHANPNKQPDGDPGPDSARKSPADERDAEQTDTLQDRSSDQ